MLKKAVVSGIFILLIGLLVAGAVNRTLARSTSGGEQRDSQASAAQAGGGRSAAEQAPITWETVSGQVSQVDADALVVALPAGGKVSVEGQPWRYAQGQGFTAQAGEDISLAGYTEAGKFKTGALTNLATGLHLQLRDEQGRPAWRGQGSN